MYFRRQIPKAQLDLRNGPAGPRNSKSLAAAVEQNVWGMEFRSIWHPIPKAQPVLRTSMRPEKPRVFQTQVLIGDLMRKLRNPYKYTGDLLRRIPNPYKDIGDLLRKLQNTYEYPGDLMRRIPNPCEDIGDHMRKLRNPYEYLGDLTRGLPNSNKYVGDLYLWESSEIHTNTSGIL